MKGIISPIMIVAGLVLIVIAAQLAGVDILGTLAEQAGIGTGRFTVVSIYAEDTIVPGTDLSRTYMVATAVANNGAETIIGSVQPYEFKGLSGYGTANIFSIRMTNLMETAKYRVLNQQMNNIFIIDYVVISAGTTCSAHLGHPVAWDVRCTAITCIGQSLDTSKRVCAWWRTIAVEAPIRHESTKSEARVQLTSSTATDTVTISNEQRSGSFTANGELVGTVNWVGGLVSGVQPPSASGYVVYYDKQKNYWKIMESYNKYAREYTGNFAEVKSNMARYHDNEHVDINIAIRDIQNYRNFMFGYTAQDTSISTGFVWDKRYDATGSATGLLYNMPISSMLPMLKFRMKASWLGVQVDIGQPRINKPIVPIEFTSGGGDGRIKVSITNIGAQPGSFDISLEQCTKFTQSYPVVGEQFNPSQTRVIEVPVQSTGAAKADEQTCTIKVCDASGFGTCDTASVDITMTEARWCTEGSTETQGKCIVKCINNEWKVEDCCEYGFEKDFLGAWGCKPEPGVNGNGFPDIFSMLASAIGLFIAGLVVAFIILIILVVLSIFIPGLIFLKFLKSVKIFIIVLIVLAIALAFLFTPFVSQVYVAYIAELI